MVTVVEARGVDPTKRWRCVLRLPGQQQAAWQKTHGRRGAVDHDTGEHLGPRWGQSFELRHGLEPATIVLVRVGSPVAAKKEVEVAFANVPRVGLASGNCAAFWVDLKVIEGKDAAEALGGGGGGWGDELAEWEGDTPRAGGELEAKVEGIKSAFAHASAGLKKAFGGIGGGGIPHTVPGGAAAAPAAPTRSGGRGRNGAGGEDKDAGQPKLLVRVAFVPKGQLEFAPTAGAGAGGAPPEAEGGCL